MDFVRQESSPSLQASGKAGGRRGECAREPGTRASTRKAQAQQRRMVVDASRRDATVEIGSVQRAQEWSRTTIVTELVAHANSGDGGRCEEAEAVEGAETSVALRVKSKSRHGPQQLSSTHESSSSAERTSAAVPSSHPPATARSIDTCPSSPRQRTESRSAPAETASPQSATTVNGIAIAKGSLTAQVTSATRCIGSSRLSPTTARSSAVLGPSRAGAPEGGLALASKPRAMSGIVSGP